MVTKLLPLIIMTTGVVANADRIKGMLTNARHVAIQAEVNEISHLLVLDQISGAKLPATTEEFNEYLRKNMRLNAQVSDNTTRDPAKDSFGTPYRLAYVTGGVIVSSAGPDLTFDTCDDIYSKRSF